MQYDAPLLERLSQLDSCIHPVLSFPDGEHGKAGLWGGMGGVTLSAAVGLCGVRGAVQPSSRGAGCSEDQALRLHLVLGAGHLLQQKAERWLGPESPCWDQCQCHRAMG